MNEYKQFKFFLLIVFLFAFCLLVFIGVVFSIGKLIDKKDPNAYMLALQDKKHLLEEKTPGGRIIFIGGSNVAFGVDSAEVQKAFNRKVINMGLNADLGLKFMINDARDKFYPGDVVVIIPEYENFFGVFQGNQTLVDTILYIYPENISKLDFMQMIYLSKYIPMVAMQKIINEVFYSKSKLAWSELYKRDNFNAFGDMVGHLELDGSNDIKASSFATESIDKNVSNFLNKFYREMKEKNVQVVFAYPDYMDKYFSESKKEIFTLEDILKRSLEIPVLSSAERYSFPESYFFDTVYHLNKEGRKLRTNMLIEDLKNVVVK